MTSRGDYAPEAAARIVVEAAKRPGRTPFERDRARVLHSASLRRLSAKTQVLGPGTDDFLRNRLTHSLEVAQVARELGKSIGCDPDVVDSAALAHDLGHPPFGHNGERALDDAARDCGGFEGNAQTLRILTRLESKAFAPDGSSVGLNLTRATLDACVKYPWLRSDAPAASLDDPDRLTKFGAYTDDVPAFTWLRGTAPVGQRSVEAQVMDLADDIAYCVHDVEDAVVGRRFRLEEIDDDRPAIWTTAREWYLGGASDDALGAAYDRLRRLPQWPPGGYDGRRQSLAALKSLTSALIGRFVMSAHTATMQAHGPGPLIRHAADLVVPEGTSLEIAVLKSVTAHFVMRADGRVDQLRDQRDLVTALFEAISSAGPAALEPEFVPDFDAAQDDAARTRVVVDQIASLTDVSALAWAARLV